MRYLVIREPGQMPKTIIWGEKTPHPAMMKKNGIPQDHVSSAGYVTYRGDLKQFFITWHTRYPSDPNEEIDAEDKRLILKKMVALFGEDEAMKQKMAREFERQQKRNAEIEKEFAMSKLCRATR